MMFVLMLTSFVIAKKRGYRTKGAKIPKVKDLLSATWEAKWALLFPVLLLVAIRGGLFTPSEVGAFAVVYAIAVGIFAHKELSFEKIIQASSNALSDIGMIMFIILMSGLIGYAIIIEQLPQNIANAMLSLSSEPHVVFALILIMLFIAGLFIESTVMVLLLTPIFVPIVTKLGVDPVHFGILMMSIVTLGSMTPPVGVAMYTVCSLLDCEIDEYIKEAIPFLGAVLSLVFVLIFFPDLVLFLPGLVF
jgi:tripartite ATP-independent transporter DctM subunit